MDEDLATGDHFFILRQYFVFLSLLTDDRVKMNTMYPGAAKWRQDRDIKAGFLLKNIKFDGPGKPNEI
jgi:hypothetical protein